MSEISLCADLTPSQNVLYWLFDFTIKLFLTNDNALDKHITSTLHVVATTLDDFNMILTLYKANVNLYGKNSNVFSYSGEWLHTIYIT